MSHPITLEDVADYLATLKDDDIVGECANAHQCLLARSLNWLYPEEAPWNASIDYYRTKRQYKTHPFPPLLRNLASAFDVCRVSVQPDGREPITKAQLKSHLSEGLWHAYRHDLYDSLYAALF